MAYSPHNFKPGALYIFLEKCYLYKEQPEPKPKEYLKSKAALFKEGTIILYIGIGDFSYTENGAKFPIHKFLYDNCRYYIFTTSKVPLLPC